MNDQDRISSLALLLFEFLQESCLAEGGDGDSMYVGKNYKQLAKGFRRWADSYSKIKWEELENADCILFQHGQEAIWFTDNEEVCPHGITIVKSKFL